MKEKKILVKLKMMKRLFKILKKNTDKKWMA